MLLLLVFLASSSSAAELFTPPATCVCDPLCEAVAAADDARQSASPGGGECRLVERPDCPCCRVCAADAAGAACDPAELPCDANKGLECDAATNTCKGRRLPVIRRVVCIYYLVLLSFRHFLLRICLWGLTR